MKCNVVARAAPKNEILKKNGRWKKVGPIFLRLARKNGGPIFLEISKKNWWPPLFDQRKNDDPPYWTKKKMMTPTTKIVTPHAG